MARAQAAPPPGPAACQHWQAPWRRLAGRCVANRSLSAAAAALPVTGLLVAGLLAVAAGLAAGLLAAGLLAADHLLEVGILSYARHIIALRQQGANTARHGASARNLCTIMPPAKTALVAAWRWRRLWCWRWSGGGGIGGRGGALPRRTPKRLILVRTARAKATLTTHLRQRGGQRAAPHRKRLDAGAQRRTSAQEIVGEEQTCLRVAHVRTRRPSTRSRAPGAA